MIMSVKIAINVRVFDSKIRAQIQDADAGGKQWLRKLGRQSVGQRQKNDRRILGDLFRVRIGKSQAGGGFMMGKPWKNFGQSFSSELTRGRNGKIDVRVAE